MESAPLTRLPAIVSLERLAIAPRASRNTGSSELTVGPNLQKVKKTPEESVIIKAATIITTKATSFILLHVVEVPRRSVTNASATAVSATSVSTVMRLAVMAEQ